MKRTKVSATARRSRNEAKAKNLKFLRQTPEGKTPGGRGRRRTSRQNEPKATSEAGHEVSVPVHDGISINMPDNSSPQQVAIRNIPEDLLIDWSEETDTESGGNGVVSFKSEHRSVLQEPGKTYRRGQKSRIDQPENRDDHDGDRIQQDGTPERSSKKAPEPVRAPGKQEDQDTGSQVDEVPGNQVDEVPGNQVDEVPGNQVDQPPGVCVCGQQAMIDQLKTRNEKQAAKIRKLKRKLEDSKNRSNRLTDALSSKVLGEPLEDVFSVIEGFLSKEKLMQLSMGGQKSDYLFIRLLMRELWPTGVVNRSVTGRSSNNPLGRGGAAATDTTRNTPSALEPDKVQYCHDRLEEHRRYLGDPKTIARTRADECGRLMARVIAYYSKNPARW